MIEKIELGTSDVGRHVIGNSPKGRGDLERVFIFPAIERRGKQPLRYELPSYLRSIYFSIRTFQRNVKADGLEIPLQVVVVRRRS